MVKKKPLHIIVSPLFSRCLAYNIFSGNIHLPNLKGHNITGHVPESRIGLECLVQSLSHENMHKWLHENINHVAARQWDDVDKGYLGDVEFYIFSAY